MPACLPMMDGPKKRAKHNSVSSTRAVPFLSSSLGVQYSYRAAKNADEQVASSIRNDSHLPTRCRIVIQRAQQLFMMRQ